LNADILAGNSTLNAGMDLIVPKTAEQINAPVPCAENNYWECWTAPHDYSLWNATLIFSVSNEMICNLNKIENCDLILEG